MALRPGSLTPESRLADRALVLAIATFVLLTPPMIAVFDLSVAVFGIPLLHLYAFGVWIAAIVIGGVISRRLMRRQAAAPPIEDGG
jgi:hypothetical protein